MKTQISVVLLCAVMMSVSFTGCGGNSEKASSQKETTEQSGLCTTLNIDGNEITLPCQFSEFGDNIRLDISMLIPADDNDVYGAIYKDDARIGRVILKDYDMDDEDVSDNIVTYLELNPDMGFDGVDFTYQGFTNASSKEKIVEKFGTPDEEHDNNVCYYLKNNGYVEFEFIREFTEIESIKIKSE